jgi:sorbose reductase
LTHTAKGFRFIKFSNPPIMSMSESDCAPSRPGFPRPVPDTPSNVVDQLKLTDKVCVVTGASDGIGLAVCEAFAEAGAASVALCYNTNPAAVDKAEEIAKIHGTKTKAYKVDVTQSEEVERVIAEIVKDFGRIDVFVANAGMSISKGILDTTIEEYRQQMAVNGKSRVLLPQTLGLGIWPEVYSLLIITPVDGTVFCAKHIGPVFRQQGSGSLIVTSSISAHIVNVPVDQPVYNATKAFVSHFAKSIAREWREFARVNIVSPGFFDTKMGAGPEGLQEAYRMTPMGRQGHVKEVKGLYVYLASEASSYMTGSDVLLDGGYVLP